MQIIPQSSFKPVRWKNGTGTTHEAIRVPEVGDAFVWRVSVAQIDASGPFSDFAAYNRTMVLLKGNGLRLKFDHGQQHTLVRVGEMAQFDGALRTHCHLLDGPCVDLNLMVAKTKPMIARVESLQGNMDIQATQSESALIFGIDAGLGLDVGDDGPRRLQPWDLAIVTNGAVRVTPEPRRSPAPAAVFVATIHHS
ncbi:MAG TPA: HutD family protein [Steroidobacteraceae bacterium]